MKFTKLSITVGLVLMAANASSQDSLFAPPVNYAVGYYPVSVFSVDFDGDFDLAVTNALSDNVQWWPMQSWIRKGTVPNLFRVET